MPVYVNRSGLPRRVVSLGRSIVANQGNHNTSITQLILNILHVNRVREGRDGRCRLRVFVLGLDQDDRSTICDLGFGNGCADILHVANYHEPKSIGMMTVFTYLSVAARKSGALVLNVPLTR